MASSTQSISLAERKHYNAIAKANAEQRKIDEQRAQLNEWLTFDDLTNSERTRLIRQHDQLCHSYWTALERERHALDQATRALGRDRANTVAIQASSDVWHGYNA